MKKIIVSLAVLILSMSGAHAGEVYNITRQLLAFKKRKMKFHTAAANRQRV